jgi:hypothetical protein
MAGGLCGLCMFVVAPCGCSLWGIFGCSSVQSEEFLALGQTRRWGWSNTRSMDFTLNEKSVVGCSLCHGLLSGDKRFFSRNGWLNGWLDGWWRSSRETKEEGS